MIYIAVFTTSAMLFGFSEMTKMKWLRQLLIVLAILIPSLLAGWRDINVGTDTFAYQYYYFKPVADAHGIINYFKYYINTISQSLLSDNLFLVTTYVIAKLTGSFGMCLFAYQALTIFFIYFTLKKWKMYYPKLSIGWGILWYYLFLYNFSINGVRQSMAIAILFLAVTYLTEQNYFKYILFAIIAIFFHSSAIVGIPIYVMYCILKDGRKVSALKRFVQAAIAMLLFIVAILLVTRGMPILVSLGIMKVSYLSMMEKSTSISVTAVLEPLIYVTIPILFYRQNKSKYREHLFLISFGVMYFLINCFFASISSQVLRITYYFIPMIVLNYMEIIGTRIKNRWLLKICFTVIIMFFWWLNNVSRGYNETVPYILAFAS